MESHSQETLRRVQENDNILTKLVIGMRGFVHGSCPHGGFNPSDGRDFSQLGVCIAENTHLTMMEVRLIQLVMDILSRDFMMVSKKILLSIS